MSRWISLIVLLGIIAVTGVVLYKVMATFLLPLFLASVLTVIFRPVHAWILPRCKKRTALAAALTTLVILVTVLAPVTAVFTFAVREGMGAAGSSGSTLDRAQFQMDRFREKLKLQVPFRKLPDDPTRETGDALAKPEVTLRDVDLAMNGLPEQLSIYEQFATQELEQMQFIEDGLQRLEHGLVRRFDTVQMRPEIAAEDLTAEMRSVKGLLRSGRYEQTMKLLQNLQNTLYWTQQYAYRGEAVLAAPLSLEELRRRYDPSPTEPLAGASIGGSTAESATDGSTVVADETRPSKTDEEPSDVASSGAAADKPVDENSPPTLAELKRQFGSLKSTYEAFRMDLMGGPFWAGLIHVANPDVDQIESWRFTSQRYLRGWLPSVAGQATAFLGSMLLGLAIMSLSVFYFLKDGPAMVQSLMRLSPLDDKYERELLVEFDKVSRAVVLATLLSAVAQGLLAGLAYFFAGFESVFLLTSLTIVLSMVPFVGAAAIWFPAALWLGLVDERYLAALVFFVYCFGVVSMVDNLIKPYVLHGQSKLHPLLALLSVLGGVQALGPIGILVGPMVVSFLQALLNILHHELKNLG